MLKWGCSMPRTWCVRQILVMVATWLLRLSSVDACPPRRWMNKCLTFRTRTHPTSLNGSQTTSRHLCATSHRRDWRWQWHLLAILPLSRRCSSVWPQHGKVLMFVSRWEGSNKIQDICSKQIKVCCFCRVKLSSGILHCHVPPQGRVAT